MLSIQLHTHTHTAPGCWLHAKQRHTSQRLLRLSAVRTKHCNPFLASQHAALVLPPLSASLYFSHLNCRRLLSSPSVLDAASLYSVLHLCALRTIVRQLSWCSDYATGYKIQGPITFPEMFFQQTVQTVYVANPAS